MDILTKRNHYHSWCDKTYTKPRYGIQEPHNCSVGLACNIHRIECFRHLIGKQHQKSSPYQKSIWTSTILPKVKKYKKRIFGNNIDY